MFDRDLWAEIFHSIKMNKLRTFLTGFSVAWGIFILVLLLASVNGMQNGFASQFNDDASNAIFISPAVTTKPYDGFEAGRRIKFTNNDLEYIKGKGSYSLRGVSPHHKFTEKTIISTGRYINDNDIEKKLKVIVIGRKVKEDLFAEEDPLGKVIQMNNSTYKIVGVFTDDGNDREERIIYAPVSTLQRLYKNTDQIDQIILTYNPEFSFAEALNFSDVLEVVMKRRHRVAPDDQGAIYLNNNAEGFSNVSNFTNMLRFISIGVGFLILLAGIVGIGNILVFIIKERTKEIGIRKALGAKPSQVINLVILESVFITSFSGLGGMLFAIFLVKGVASKIDTPAFSNPTVDVFTVVTACIILIVSGILAGLVPAIKAANVKPIVALRAD